MIGRRKSGLGTPLILAVLCAGLGWVLYHDLEASIPPPERIDQPALQLPPLPGEPDFALAPLQAFLEVVERPLFASNRRPPAQAAPVVAPERPLGLALSGTVLSDQSRFALVRPTEGGAIQRLKIGDRVSGWTLVAVEADRVTFRRQGDERQLILAFDQPPAVPRPAQRQRRRGNRGAADADAPEAAPQPAEEVPPRR